MSAGCGHLTGILYSVRSVTLFHLWMVYYRARSGANVYMPADGSKLNSVLRSASRLMESSVPESSIAAVKGKMQTIPTCLASVRSTVEGTGCLVRVCASGRPTWISACFFYNGPSEPPESPAHARTKARGYLRSLKTGSGTSKSLRTAEKHCLYRSLF